MTAVTYTAKHTIVGLLKDGKKVVFSDFSPDAGDAAETVVRVAPLNKILAYTWGIKQNNLSGSSTTVTVNPAAGNVGLTYTSGNLLVIQADTASTFSGDCIITVMSIGV